MPTRPRTGTSNFRHEHHHALQDKSGSDRVSFRVKSRAADPNHTPLFFKGDIIKGEVQFDLAKAETLTGLTITVCASQSYSTSTTVVPWPRPSALTLVSLAIFLALNDSRRDDSWLGQEEELFLDITKPVWTPASPSEGKIVGQHTFPVPVFYHHPAREHRDCTRPQSGTNELSAPAYILEARKSRIHRFYRLFVIVRCGRLRATGEQAEASCTVGPSPLHFTCH